MASETQKTSPKVKPLTGIPIQADFTKPLDFLFHCHQKIASNLEALRRATADLYKPEEKNLAQTIATIDTVLTHLSTAGIKHTKDEEESLFPRLRKYNDSVVSEVFEIMDQLESQHKRAANIENSLTKMIINMTASETISKEKIDLFNDLAESLYDLYRPHIQIENEFVFPTAAKILSQQEMLEMGQEMYQRRQLKIGRTKS